MMHSEQAYSDSVQISKTQTEFLEMQRLQRIRKENDDLRRKIKQKLEYHFEMFKQINQKSNNNTSQNRDSTMDNEQFIDSLVNFLKQSKNILQSQNTAKVYQQQQLNEQMSKKQLKLQDIKNLNQSKESFVQKTISNIKQKTIKLNQLQEELLSVFDEYKNLQQQKVQKDVKQKSVESITLDEIQKNWEKQSVYIIALIDQRAVMRKQCSLLQKANKLLEQKVNKYSNQLINSQQRKRTIDELKIKNQQLKNILDQQKRRLQHLQEMKLTLVIEKQSNLATNIVQKWDEQKRNCQNLLLTIIERVNRQLPYKKLDDVNEIIKAAEEEYIKRQQERRRQNNSQMMMEQDQPMIQQGQSQQYQI